MDMDDETRANRFIGAMDCLADLFGGSSHSLPINNEHIACLIDLMAEEAKILTHRLEPPRPRPAND